MDYDDTEDENDPEEVNENGTHEDDNNQDYQEINEIIRMRMKTMKSWMMKTLILERSMKLSQK